jgi:hypothetical protein
MIYPYVATALLSACLAFGGAWQVQNWRYGAKEKDHAQAALAQVAEARVMDSKRQSLLASTQNTATVRAGVLRAAGAAAGDELERLRAQSAAALLAARASHAACIERADALGAVFDQCAVQYEGLASIADRHASDVKTLSDAWPVE